MCYHMYFYINNNIVNNVNIYKDSRARDCFLAYFFLIDVFIDKIIKLIDKYLQKINKLVA